MKSPRFNKASKSTQERDSLSLSKKRNKKSSSSRARRVWSRIVAAANFSGRGGPKLNSQVLQKRVLLQKKRKERPCSKLHSQSRGRPPETVSRHLSNALCRGLISRAGGKKGGRGRDETSRVEIKGLSKLAKPWVKVFVCKLARLKFRMTSANKSTPAGLQELNKHGGRRWLRRCFRAEFERGTRFFFSLPLFSLPRSSNSVVGKVCAVISMLNDSLFAEKLGNRSYLPHPSVSSE